MGHSTATEVLAREYGRAPAWAFCIVIKLKGVRKEGLSPKARMSGNLRVDR